MPRAELISLTGLAAHMPHLEQGLINATRSDSIRLINKAVLEVDRTYVLHEEKKPAKILANLLWALTRRDELEEAYKSEDCLVLSHVFDM